MREGEGGKPTAQRGLGDVDRPAKGTPKLKIKSPSRMYLSGIGIQWVFFIGWFCVEKSEQTRVEHTANIH